MSPTAGQRLADSAPITGGSTSADTPVLDTLADMTAASVEHNSLTPRDYMLARLDALIAVDAPPVSYFANEDIQGVMIAVAPVVGAPRVMSADGHILRALCSSSRSSGWRWERGWAADERLLKAVTLGSTSGKLIICTGGPLSIVVVAEARKAVRRRIADRSASPAG